ncbi:hypothetical protein FA95DRAFT_1561679, partial [Auriscalpium vulgare]
MKTVQGTSTGAGSGKFHVHKANRRRASGSGFSATHRRRSEKGSKTRPINGREKRSRQERPEPSETVEEEGVREGGEHFYRLRARWRGLVRQARGHYEEIAA